MGDAADKQNELERSFNSSHVQFIARISNAK